MPPLGEPLGFDATSCGIVAGASGTGRIVSLWSLRAGNSGASSIRPELGRSLESVSSFKVRFWDVWDGCASPLSWAGAVCVSLGTEKGPGFRGCDFGNAVKDDG